jgi:hypothetical protein
MDSMKFSDHVDGIFDEIKDLSMLQKHTLKERYRFLMEEYRRRCILYATLFYVLRITMTVGSLAVPALLSIQTITTSSNSLYWFTWTLSLAVTTSNGIMTLFKLDKRFFMLHATAERLRSETWQYIQLSGRYSGHYDYPHKPTHSNQYTHYCTQLEKINMKRIDDEYIKTGDEIQSAVSNQQANQKAGRDAMVPSPPDPALQTPGSGRIKPIPNIEDDDEMGYPKENNKEESVVVKISEKR